MDKVIVGKGSQRVKIREEASKFAIKETASREGNKVLRL
jgi:hypothetical protein